MVHSKNFVFILCLKISYLYALNNGINLTTVKDGVEITAATCAVTHAGVKMIRSITSYVNPSLVQQYKSADLNRQINALRAEEEFNQCLVLNAIGERSSDGLPKKCKDSALALASLAGSAYLKDTKEEFIQAILDLELPQQVASENNESSIIVTGVLCLGGVAVLLWATPIVLPGTFVAAKTTAITSSIKAFCAASATKASSGIVATKAAAVSLAGTATNFGNEACESIVKKTKQVLEKTSKMPLSEKIIFVNSTIEMSNKFLPEGSFIFNTAEEELKHLYQQCEARPSLADRIKLQHKKSLPTAPKGQESRR